MVAVCQRLSVESAGEGVPDTGCFIVGRGGNAAAAGADGKVVDGLVMSQGRGDGGDVGGVPNAGGGVPGSGGKAPGAGQEFDLDDDGGVAFFLREQFAGAGIEEGHGAIAEAGEEAGAIGRDVETDGAFGVAVGPERDLVFRRPGAYSAIVRSGIKGGAGGAEGEASEEDGIGDLIAGD